MQDETAQRSDDEGIHLLHELTLQNRDAISLFSADPSFVTGEPTHQNDDDYLSNVIGGGGGGFAGDSLDSVRSGESVFKAYKYIHKKIVY